MADNSKRLFGAVVAFLVTLFILISVYFSLNDASLDYYLYLFGDDLHKTQRVLIRIISKDGFIVPDAKITVDGRSMEGILLDTAKPVREISFSVGGRDYTYEVDFGAIFDKSGKRLPDDWFTQKELSEGREAARRIAASPKRLYVLPATVRMFAEVPNRVTLFCFTAEGPCDDPSVTIDTVEVSLQGGVGTADLNLPIQNQTEAVFADGSTATLYFPYVGRMFSFTDEGDRIVLRTLVEARNVHIDCWRAGTWQFTDVVTGTPEGIKLPVNYAACDRIQASFDSSGPGGNFLVRSRETAAEGEITDPYYQALLADIRASRPELAGMLRAQYPASHFFRLTALYDGADYESVFVAEKKGRLAIVWWLILLLALTGIVAFAIVSYRRLSVVEGDEGEFVTMTRKQQRFMILVMSLILSVFFVMLLVILRKLG